MPATSTLLAYENQMFLDCFHEDGLLITAKGLGLERILLGFIRVYCDPSSLVLVLNTTSFEENYFLEQLEACGVKHPPKVITTEYSANERQAIYLQGGVLFVTSRILVVDFLTDRIPVDHLAGILVCKAHKIIESCQEAFILRLYRQRNKTGFIKAFSDRPLFFTTGYCNIERVMKGVFVRKLYLWPRFHADVVSCLDQHKVDVVEVQLQLTPMMTACQAAILDLINACIKELRKSSPILDSGDLTVENALTRSFEKVIRQQLDPILHQLGSKVKTLVADIRTLRLVLRYLTQYDCVTFFHLVNSIRTSEKTFGNNSGWLFMDAADSLFVHAKERVLGSIATDKTKPDKKTKTSSADPVLESNPKWSALRESLEEIHEENDMRADKGNVLIVAEDDRTCSQIKEYLIDGARNVLTKLYNKHMAPSGAPITLTESTTHKSNEKNKGKGKKQDKGHGEFTLTQMLGEPESATSAQPPMSDGDEHYGLLSKPITIIQSLNTSDTTSFVRSLHQFQPRFVILYDPDMHLIRQLEVFRASQPGVPLRVYFLMYMGSTEEQRYLTTITKEKDAFSVLIKEKASMVIQENIDGRDEHNPKLERGGSTEVADTRKGGGVPEQLAHRKVIVDMREFRSELPSLIHKRGIDIEPVTLEVGDYILTRDMCVERKSVSDLIGSLNNGRLYNQCVSMCRCYKHPILLIEFDANKSFSLQSQSSLSSDVSINNVTSKLALITLHFPRLRILWCQSPYATAELFDELKTGQGEPDVSAAAAMTAIDDSKEMLQTYNHAPHDVLMKLPGINTKNCRTIMNNVQNIAELCTFTEAQLSSLLQNSTNACELYEFLHMSSQKATKSTVKTKVKFSTRPWKRK